MHSKLCVYVRFRAESLRCQRAGWTAHKKSGACLPYCSICAWSLMRGAFSLSFSLSQHISGE